MTQRGSATSEVAAVDLGSNSFHLVVAKEEDGHLLIVDRLRTRVALASGIGPRGALSPEARERALACLDQFGQRLRRFARGRVRAVGTNTFRVIERSSPFLREASRRLGHPIEVISGAEEARLIYRGVRFCTSLPGQRILVVDIGGGSTEVVVGRGPRPELASSHRVGCVRFRERFFSDGMVDRDRFEAAVTAARLEFAPSKRAVREAGWEVALGSSGTAQAVAGILRENGIGDGSITREGLEWLRDELVDLGHEAEFDLAGMSDSRKPTLAPGLAILLAAFRALRVEQMVVAEGALREGVLEDLVGRLHARDSRGSAVKVFAKRHRIDTAQAQRVATTAETLRAAVAGPWDLEAPGRRETLRWAAQLHEAGLGIHHSGFHKHGAYLVQHSDLPGFSREEQEALALLVLHHRKRLRPSLFKRFGREGRALLRLSLLLRLAVRLHRDRGPLLLPAIRAEAGKSLLELAFPRAWCEDHPLTLADLEEEAAQWAEGGYRLVVAVDTAD
jgi:exopolyphosphatase/guanosine-5'-triphosphate,3'-diphosphate pyrophosphatase